MHIVILSVHRPIYFTGYFMKKMFNKVTQQAFTSSNLITETLEQGVKCVQS